MQYYLRTLVLLSTSFVAASWESNTQKQTGRGGLYTYNFQPGVEHSFSTNEVNGSFCDPNSPLSLSGYFGGELMIVLYAKVYDDDSNIYCKSFPAQLLFQ